MKSWIPFTLSAICLLCSPVFAQSDKANDPFVEPSELEKQSSVIHQIRIHVEYIEVSQELLNDLMFGEKAAPNDTEMRKQLSALIKGGKAKIVETQICTTLNGIEAESKSQEEFIYPTEYDPAEIFPNPIDGQGNLKQEALDTKISAVGPNPTAFATQYLGPSLKISAVAEDGGKRIALALHSEIVEHTGKNIWAEWKGHHGDSSVQMPTFYTLLVKTSLSLTEGKPMLAAALTPKDGKGKSDSSRKLMVFVRADLTKLSE